MPQSAAAAFRNKIEADEPEVGDVPLTGELAELFARFVDDLHAASEDAAAANQEFEIVNAAAKDGLETAEKILQKYEKWQSEAGIPKNVSLAFDRAG